MERQKRPSKNKNGRSKNYVVVRRYDEKSKGEQGRELEGIFYAEFDNVTGPKVVYAYPEGALRGEQFDAISNYVITEACLSERVLMIRTFQKAIMVYPVCLSGAHYGRNALLFSVGFVLKETIGEESEEEHKSCLSKIGAFVKRMEISHGGVSSPYKVWISGLLKNAYVGLTDESRPYCVIDFDRLLRRAIQKKAKSSPNLHNLSTPATACKLGLFRMSRCSNEQERERSMLVNDHDVPVLLDTAYSSTVGHQHSDKPCSVDLIIHRILPFIDGVRFVRSIAECADADLTFVRNALGSMRMHNIVDVIDIFQFSNVYALTDRIHDLATPSALQDECVLCVCPNVQRHFVVHEEEFSLTPTSSERSRQKMLYKTLFGRIFRLYCAFRGNRSVSDVFREHDTYERSRVKKKGQAKTTATKASQKRRSAESDYPIDPNRLVAFGVLGGFLRRVHEYPFMDTTIRTRVVAESATANENIHSNVVASFDGSTSIDAICTRCYTSRSKVLEIAHSFGSDCVVVMR